jgi:hypothetical protein
LPCKFNAEVDGRAFTHRGIAFAAAARVDIGFAVALLLIGFAIAR